MPLTPSTLLDWAALLLIASPLTYKTIMRLTERETPGLDTLAQKTPPEPPKDPTRTPNEPNDTPQITHWNPEPTPSEPPATGSLYTKKQLAEVAGVSPQALGRNWLPRLLDVVPHSQLMAGRKYTQLALDMIRSQRAAREDGLDGQTWADGIAWPRWGDLNPTAVAEVVQEAEDNAALVPVELIDVTSDAHVLLQDAKALRQAGQGVMDAILTGVALEYEQSDEIAELTDEQLIALDEMQRIAREQQIRAKVRAEFQAKQQQAKQQQLQRRSDQLTGKGGSHA